MSRLRLSEDIRPVTEFRAHASAFLEQVQTTKRPVVLTQHGRSAAVLLHIDVYEDLVETAALLGDIKAAEAQIAAGKVVSHTTAAKRLRAKLLK